MKYLFKTVSFQQERIKLLLSGNPYYCFLIFRSFFRILCCANYIYLARNHMLKEYIVFAWFVYCISYNCCVTVKWNSLRCKETTITFPVAATSSLHLIQVQIYTYFDWISHPNKMFRFPFPVSRSDKKQWIVEGVWVPEKAGLLSKKAWLQSQLEDVVFSTTVNTRI